MQRLHVEECALYTMDPDLGAISDTVRAASESPFVSLPQTRIAPESKGPQIFETASHVSRSCQKLYKEGNPIDKTGGIFT
jgi:hypothetical protein